MTAEEIKSRELRERIAELREISDSLTVQEEEELARLKRVLRRLGGA
jgi:hypothetical protein